MAMFETWITAELTQLPTIRKLKQFFTLDSQANRIGAEVYSGGEPVQLSGTVSARIVRADGETIQQAGTVSGNTAWVDLPAGAYAVAGRVTVFLVLTDGGTVTTLGGVEGTVYRSR